MDIGSTVVLFDGVCHLCDGAVRFILKREKSANLYFAPLQSETGEICYSSMDILKVIWMAWF